MREAGGKGRNERLAKGGTDNWQSRGDAFHRHRGTRSGRQDYIRLQLDEFLCQFRERLRVSVGVAVINFHRLAFDIPKLMQAFAEGSEAGRLVFRRVYVE